METRLTKKLAPAGRAKLFLQTLRQECLPMDAALGECGATIQDLGRWMKGQKFRQSLKTVMKHRRDIHEMTAALTRYWAISQLTTHLREQLESPPPEPERKTDATPPATPPTPARKAIPNMKFETVLELLRKLGSTSAKPTKHHAKPLARAFVHPDVPKSEQATLIELLTRGDHAVPSKKAA